MEWREVDKKNKILEFCWFILTLGEAPGRLLLQFLLDEFLFKKVMLIF